jgi:hypothetical protein
LWTSPTWVALKFSVDDATHFMYSFDGSATKFTARANGDIDCDGSYSTFEMYGEVNSIYADGPAGSASLYRENELE